MLLEEDLERIAQSLTDHGYAVVSEFLQAETCDSLIAEIEELQANGRLGKAGIGKGAQHQVRDDIRSDLIHWLDEDHLPQPAAAAWEQLETLRTALNRRLYLGLAHFEGHLTCYPPGARYDKHVDNFSGTSARVLSCIVYLNRDWTSGDGGELRIYDRHDHDRIDADILPEAGKLVCFLSRETPHEVLVTNRRRFSLTGWFRTK